MKKTLSVGLLRIDGNTQNRLAINQEVVDDYAQLIVESDGKWPLGELDVFHDGSEYFVADGFHRTLSAERAKCPEVPCQIHNGTASDARIFGMTANDRHGLRMNRADKRACVEWLLDNGDKMTQTEVAQKAGVSKRLVQTIIAERNPESIAGKATPPEQEYKAQIAPYTPISGDKDRIAALNKCIPAVQKGINSNTFTATDAQIKALAKATPEKQNAVAKAARSGTPLETAMAEQKVGTAKPKKPPAQDYGKCPVCAKTKWTEDEDGVICAKCRHPHGEPAGDPDEDRLNTQRQKTRKTVDALMRAFDDLQTMHAHTCNPCQLTEDDSKDPIRCCKRLLAIGKAWK